MEAKLSLHPERNDAAIDEAIRVLIENYGGDPVSFEAELVKQIIETGLKLLVEGHDIGQIKVITRALKEMRYAYRVFNRYQTGPCVSIFGSARTPEDHPDYLAAKTFSAAIASHGWMCITGAANGIMKAAAEGPAKSQSFGLSIRLPFEADSNTIIEGDPKLIVFRYFFTRKLMFMSHSQALAAFPGGFGTQDELFEVLTLMQTGKSSIIPVVLIDGRNGIYWSEWEKYIKESLLENHWISPEDERLYYIAPSPDAAVKHILKFYSRYHSSRYVKEMLVLRLNTPLTTEQIDILNTKYNSLFAQGKLSVVPPYPEETDHLDLPRIAFHHTRKQMSILRMLIDDINEF